MCMCGWYAYVMFIISADLNLARILIWRCSDNSPNHQIKVPAKFSCYRTAGNIGGQLNLAVWRLAKRPSNLNPSNLSAIYIYPYYLRVRVRAYYIYGTIAKFKSANIFISAARDQTAKFKYRQYFRLYGIWYY